MDEHDWLAARFETDRPRLRALAYRVLGSADEADDAVQESWIRLSRADGVRAKDLDGCLRTTVARVSLHMLRSRKARPEILVDATEPGEPPADPEQEVLLADSVRLAMLVVLDTLTPPERLAYVLHDMFAVPFEEIAAVVDRALAAALRLAGRARDRVRRSGPAGGYGGGPGAGGAKSGVTGGVTGGATGDPKDAGKGAAGSAYGESVYDAAGSGDDGVDPAVKAGADIAGAFFAASRDGDFEALLTVLDPDHPVRPEAPAGRAGAAGDADAETPDAETPAPPDPAAPHPTPPEPAAPRTAGARAERRGDAVVGATEVNGTESVTRVCTVRTWAPVPALIDGGAGLVWVQDGRPQIAFRFTVRDGEITGAELETDLSGLSIVY
ncbi:sigma factor [Streptomyces synnematoformans]|uniref:RNA polymerase sigma-70 region 2 domain-containing protein n=1 Tax=Streptomyces synnematoformans TaxID=415721 RepID=A0ABN2ZB02_9ACTN